MFYSQVEYRRSSKAIPFEDCPERLAEQWSPSLTEQRNPSLAQRWRWSRSVCCARRWRATVVHERGHRPSSHHSWASVADSLSRACLLVRACVETTWMERWLRSGRVEGQRMSLLSARREVVIQICFLADLCVLSILIKQNNLLIQNSNCAM